MAAKTKKTKKTEEQAQPVKKPVKTEEILNVERKLIALYTLQLIDSKIDKIRDVRGSLPLEVQDMEDEIAGLETRIHNFEKELNDLERAIKEQELKIEESEALIKKYKQQLDNVKNNREYTSLTKEIEYQEIEKQIAEKRIKEIEEKIEFIRKEIENVKAKLEERKADLVSKKAELKEIIAETEKDEKFLLEKAEEVREHIEDRYLTAYQKIRNRERNGLAVVLIEHGACGGCHNKIPPQYELDIKTHKKIIVCEYCGRILVDKEIDDIVRESLKLE